MNNRPRISIITIVLDAANTLERTIKSVLGQDFYAYEYFIIDGGSTDGSLDIIKRYQEQLSGWESRPDNGISEAFNRGLELASGEWIGFINADDWYNPGAFREIAEQAGNSEIFYGPIQYWEGNKIQEWFDADHRLLHREMTLNHPATFVRKSVFTRLGGFDPTYRYAMDYEFFLRCRLAGVHFQKTGHTLANISYGGRSDDFMAAFSEVCRAKIELGCVSPFRAQLYYHYQILRRHIRCLLDTWGGQTLISYWRRHLAAVKKITE